MTKKEKTYLKPEPGKRGRRPKSLDLPIKKRWKRNKSYPKRSEKLFCIGVKIYSQLITNARLLHPDQTPNKSETYSLPMALTSSPK